MSKMTYKPVVGNTPGKDKRNQKPDFKAKVDTAMLKQAIMGRSKKK